MPLDPDACFRALAARDRRFDGLFYVAVTTTGIYCRPICPARAPRRDRCEFYVRPAEAEKAGFRACLRCRPELAPGTASVDSVPALVARAAARIDAGYLNDRSIEALAGSLGVSARHLRRAMEAQLGVSPVGLAQTRRLGLAKQLLHDTKLPLAEVSATAGFASIRRFNAAFRARFGRPPSALRKDPSEEGADRGAAVSDCITVRLDYRPPLDWSALLEFLGARAIPDVESVDRDTYRRVVSIGDRVGRVAVSSDGHPSARVSDPGLPIIWPCACCVGRTHFQRAIWWFEMRWVSRRRGRPRRARRRGARGVPTP